LKDNANDFSDISKYTKDTSCLADLKTDPQKYFTDNIKIKYLCPDNKF